jgi:SAM-dependent methyltransferase
MNPREYEIMFAREDAYWWYRGMRLITHAFAPDLFSRAVGSWALDAGCGTGRNLVELMVGGGRAVGVDVSLRALGFARTRNSGASLVCGSVEALPFRGAVFERALSRDVLCVVPDEKRAVGEIARALTPGGTIVLSSPAFRALAGAHDRAVGGLRRYTAPGLESLFEGAGLRITRSTYANFLLAGPIWVLRKATAALSRRRPTGDVASDFGLVPAPFDGVLFSLLSLEARIVAHGRLPFGVSVFVSAVKPDQGTSVARK